MVNYKMPRKPTGRPNGQPPKVFTEEDQKIAYKLGREGVPLKWAYKTFGIVQDTFDKYLKKSYDDGKAKYIQWLCNKARERVEQGENSVLIYLLKAQAGLLEVNRTEHTGKDGKDLECKLTIAISEK